MHTKMPSDRMPQLYLCDKKYRSRIPSKEKWVINRVQVRGNGEIWYTNGPRNDELAGVRKNRRKEIKAEMTDISVAALHLAIHDRDRGKFYIYTDSSSYSSTKHSGGIKAYPGMPQYAKHYCGGSSC